MGFFRKTDYEKHSDKLHKKLTRIIQTMNSRELKDACHKVLGKYPIQGTRIFDSDYNLIQKFGHNISRDDYFTYFSHNWELGKFSDLRLAKYLIKRDILDENDSDYDYLKEFAKSEDELDYPIPRDNFSRKVKDAIRKIQGNRCAVPGCKSKRFFEFDHIKGRNDNSLSNCQMLCMYHHRLKTNEDAIKVRIERNLNEGKSLGDIRVRTKKKNPKKIRSTQVRRNNSRKSNRKRNLKRKPNSRTRR